MEFMGGADPFSDITGVQVSYYFICPTKLWLFSHNTQMEHSSDTVALGKMVHKDSYQRVRKDVQVGSINVDFVKRGDEIVLHEVKKSRKMEASHRYQLLYYLFYLKNLGVRARGMIDYPLLRRNLEVALGREEEKVIERTLSDIPGIIALPTPPKPEKKNFCRKCSYFEFCWVR